MGTVLMDEDQLGPVEDGGASAEETPDAERQGQAEAPAAQALDDAPRTQPDEIGAPAGAEQAQPPAPEPEATVARDEVSAPDEVGVAVAETQPAEEQDSGTDAEVASSHADAVAQD